MHTLGLAYVNVAHVKTIYHSDLIMRARRLVYIHDRNFFAISYIRIPHVISERTNSTVKINARYVYA